MPGVFGSLFGNRGAFRPVAQLDPDSWCEVENVCRMGVVWPWRRLFDADGSRAASQGQPVMELVAPRTDRDAEFVVWAQGGGGFTVDSQWSKSTVRAASGASIEFESALSLDSVPGRIVRFASGSATVWRAILPRLGQSVTIEATAPNWCADAYWVQIESMLATWRWTG